MSTTVLSGQDQASLTAVSHVIKSLDSDTTWKGEQKDVEEVTYAAEKLTIKQNEEDDSDSDYDPKDDEAQGLKDAEEDLAEPSSGEIAEEEPQQAIEEEVELNSEEFEREWNEAMEHVLQIASADRERILSNAKKEYYEETGNEATDDMVHEAFEVFGMDYEAESEIEAKDEELGDLDPAVFRAEFEEALQVVRNLAKQDQEQLVHSICDISQELVGKDPGVEQLSEIFGRIQGEFAEEAREEFLEFYEVSEDEDFEFHQANEVNQEQEEDQEEDDDDENDSDYSPETDPFDYSKDVEEDQFESDDDDHDEV